MPDETQVELARLRIEYQAACERIRQLERITRCERCGADNRPDVESGRISLRDWFNRHPCGPTGADDE